MSPQKGMFAMLGFVLMGMIYFAIKGTPPADALQAIGVIGAMAIGMHVVMILWDLENWRLYTASLLLSLVIAAVASFYDVTIRKVW